MEQIPKKRGRPPATKQKPIKLVEAVVEPVAEKPAQQHRKQDTDRLVYVDNSHEI